MAGPHVAAWLEGATRAGGCEDGNGNTVLAKNIEFTDFPLSQIILYFTDNTILLQGEY
jgi:hypothetical protein